MTYIVGLLTLDHPTEELNDMMAVDMAVMAL